MAEWNIISSSALAENHRFDSDYWRPRYVENLQQLSDAARGKLTLNLIRDVVSKVTGSAFYPSFVKYYGDKGLPFLRVADLGDLFIRTDNLVRIERATIKAHKQVSTIGPEDLVVAKGGTIGGVCIVTDDFGETAVCRDVIAIETTSHAVDPYYLAVFLNTRFGQLQLERNKSQQVQAHLTFPAVERIVVVYPDSHEQQRIRQIAVSSYKAASDSKNAFIQARQLLESELGLDKLSFDKPVGYTARFSELELSRRFDSEHYYPAFDNLKVKLPKHVQLVLLGSLLTYCQRGKQPIYSQNGLPVLNSKHILENEITLEGNRYAKPNPLSSLQIQNGDVLINGTGRGTIGRTAPYLINEHQAIPDNHVTILRSPTLDPAYLSFYLNSRAGKLQVEKHQRGSSGQLELYPFDIRKFHVWNAPQFVQREIRRLYDQATKSAKQSRELLDQAKSRVEQLIEEAVQS